MILMICILAVCGSKESLVSQSENNKQIITNAGDIIIYHGNSLVIYYDTNTWNFTRLGKINDVTQAELKEALGDGDVIVTFSID